MDKKLETLQRIFQLNEFVKLSADEDKAKHHHRLKIDLGKSSKRILWLLKRNGPLNQRSISKELNISPQAISEAVKKLECENLIIKDISNKNETIISLSELGNERSEVIKELIQNHANTLFDDFDENELQQVINFINKLINKENKDV